MTPYDAAMIGIVIAGMVWGALRGITWQVASIASLVLGYSVAYPLSSQLAGKFPGEPVVARALAMLTVYAAVSGGIFLAAWVVRTTLRRWKFDAFDRHLGMILGGLEGGLVGVVATLFVVSLAPGTRQMILTSPTGSAVNHAMVALGPILPAEIRDVLTPFDNAPAPLASASAEEEEAVTAAPALAPSPTPAPALRTASAGATSPTATPAPAPGQERPIETLEDLYQEGRSRLGRAVFDTAEERLRRTREQVSGAPADPGTQRGSATLDDVYERGRSRVGRAVLDTAEQGLRRTREQVTQPGSGKAAPSLNELYEEGRSRVGRAILDTAEQELQRVRGANDGTVKRR